MKHLPLVLLACGLAGLAAVPRAAYAFDIEGQNATLEDGVSHFTSPVEDFIKSNGGAQSLAMPLTGESDSSAHISDYGNAISIPGPGVEAPGWSYSSNYYQKRGY